MKTAQRESLNPTLLENETIAHLLKIVTANLNFLKTLYQQEPDNQQDITVTELSLNAALAELLQYTDSHQIYLQLINLGTLGKLDYISAPINFPRPERPVAKEKLNLPPIGFIAPIRGGKGLAAQYLAEIVGSVNWPFSSRLREFAHKRDFDNANGGTDEQRASLRQIDADIKPRFGNDTFLQWTMQMAANTKLLGETPNYTFDGFRSMEEVETFKAQGGILIYIEASYETRLERAMTNGRTPDDRDPVKFKVSDEIESQWIEPLKARADWIISNEGTPEDLAANIRGLVRNLKRIYA